MAAHSHSGTNSSIRVRLYFDYPPPAVVDSRMCWLLVDLNTCRVVADLESIIKEKFEFSRGSILNLFIEDCYLPHTESIYVVRDNDGVRVKVHCLTQVNGHDGGPDPPTTNCRKRQRDTEEGDAGEDGASAQREKNKREKRKIREEDAKEASEDERTEKRRKKKKKRETTERAADKPRPAASTKKTPTSVEKTVRPTATKATTRDESSPDFSSTLKVPPKNKPLSSASPKARTKDVLQAKEAAPRLQSTNHPPSQTVTTAATSARSGQPSSSDSEEEMEAVNQAQTEQPGCGSAARWSGGGYGRGKPRDEDRGGAGGGGSESLRRFSGDGAKESSYHTDSLTNVSVVLQNGAQSVPTQDYSSMPLLAAPPQVGQKIAFKLLELTENYSPEVSEYKEGKILSFDPTTKQIELELLHVSEAPAEPGKFDLVYQNPDGTERVEYAVSRGAWVTERWDSLLEPRLIL